MNLNQLLQNGTAQGLGRLDAQLLLLHILGKDETDRAWLIAHDQDPINLADQQRLEVLIQQRLSGVPLAYLVGYKEFMGHTFTVTPNVLVPRPDTETLVEWAIELLGHTTTPNPQVLDLGTGSGAIGVSIGLAHPAAGITLTDASQAALALALDNAASLGLTVKGLQADWFKGIEDTKDIEDSFDLIVSNPPYIAEGDAHLAALKHEPTMALTSGADGLDAIRHIITNARAHLKAGAWLILEHGFDQAARVQALMRDAGFVDVQTRRDLGGNQRCTVGQWLASLSAV